MNMIPKKLVWSETKEPNPQCHYHHVEAQAPFGRILITWKGWKGRDCPTIDDFPGDYRGPITWFDLEGAKAAAEKEWERLLNLCMELDVSDDPAFDPDFPRIYPATDSTRD